MNPYLDKKRKEEEEANPYGPPSPLPSRTTVQGPELGAGLAQTQVQALDPEEQPMEAEKARPGWEGLLDLVPGAVSAFIHAKGNGSAETRARGNQTIARAAQLDEADRNRVAASKVKATAYNNSILQRKQERKHQAEQDTIAAEGRAITADDRQRRIGKEDLAASRDAEDYDVASPKNVTLRQGIAQTFPEEWAKLTPEQQGSITVKNYEETMGLPLSEAAKQKASERNKAEEISKQKAEKDYFTPGGGLGGSNYLTLLAGGQPSAQGAPPAPGSQAEPEAPVNPLVKDVTDAYDGDIKNVPPAIMARVRGALAASQGGLSVKDMSALHQNIMGQVADDIKDTKTRERQAKQDEEAAKKADRQQDAQYAQQRNMRNLDQVRSRIVLLKKAVSKYMDKEGNLVGDIPGSGVTGNLWKPAQLALSPEGREIMKLKKELLDTRLRAATGANAPDTEVKTFKEMGGIGEWDTDQDMVSGLANAEAILNQQEAYLDANFVDSSIRFHDRIKEQEAKEAEKEAQKAAPAKMDYTKLPGYKPPNAP